MKKKGYNAQQSNSIMNIVLVDDYLNKRVIKAKPPSEYIRIFTQQNSELKKTLKGHFIGIPEEMGIWEDDYEKFLEQRAERISAALNKILGPND